jgi:hypothetical protein
VCSGCKGTVADDTDMLVEVAGFVVRVDHVRALALRMRTRFYGPYCNEACWQLDSGPEVWPGVADDLRDDAVWERLLGKDE